MAELDPRVAEVARTFFGMPEAVTVHIADARTFLRHDTKQYDLIFLDVFAGESIPWHLTTVEALADVKSRLRPGGRLLLNTVTTARGTSPGLARLEAAALTVFRAVEVYVDSDDHTDSRTLVNAILVAGDALVPSSVTFPGVVEPSLRPFIDGILDRGRPARMSVPPGTDDWADIDYADASLRAEWRKLVFADLGPNILGD